MKPAACGKDKNTDWTHLLESCPECSEPQKGENKMDFNLSLRRAMKTGQVILGQNSVEKIIAENKAELVIIAKNAPAQVRAFLAENESVSLYEFKGSSRQLGKECGRDHMVSVLAIVHAGESDILSLKSV